MAVSGSVSVPRSVAWAMVVSAATAAASMRAAIRPARPPCRAARPYSLRAIYFRRDQFRSTADCLTAAYTQRLPLEVCQ